MARRTTAEFISIATTVHGQKYGYKKVHYQNDRIKVKIKCSVHGYFTMSPCNHIRGQGCPICGIEKRAKSRTHSNIKFISAAKKVHKNQYNYNRVIYSGSANKVEIVCKIHGVFEQTPNKHLSGQGCRKCTTYEKSTTEDFIRKSNIKHHNRYDYTATIYISAFKKVTIKCSKHGPFKQDAHDHLAGKGCSQCKHPVSKAETAWLDAIGVPKKNRNKVLIISGKRVVVDGFCSDSKTVFEYNGDYWHGNPNVYAGKTINQHTKCTFAELYKRTMQRAALLRSNGFTVISKWESNPPNQ